MKTKTFRTASWRQTMALAEKMALNLRPGDCLALVGDLGSGKTTFVKGLAQGLGFKKKAYVCSPTFVILKIYPSRIPLYHFDVYRLASHDDFLRAGLDEFLQTEGISVVEWADKVENALPAGYTRVEFDFAGKSGRSIRVRTAGSRDLFGKPRVKKP
ncbi:MAG: tRNA (adenosine(37)-N6)-threonylcarbamoyltransferase complex ATPase subunit type 1 TsaE [Candidatus Omnitrophota bacterium]